MKKQEKKKIRKKWPCINDSKFNTGNIDIINIIRQNNTGYRNALQNKQYDTH